MPGQPLRKQNHASVTYVDSARVVIPAAARRHRLLAMAWEQPGGRSRARCAADPGARRRPPLSELSGSGNLAGGGRALQYCASARRISAVLPFAWVSQCSSCRHRCEIAGRCRGWQFRSLTACRGDPGTPACRSQQVAVGRPVQCVAVLIAPTSSAANTAFLTHVLRGMPRGRLNSSQRSRWPSSRKAPAWCRWKIWLEQATLR